MTGSPDQGRSSRPVDGDTLDTARMVELCARYVLRAGERVARVHEWPGRVAAVVHTSAERSYLVLPSGDFRLGDAPWVDEVVVARPLTACTDLATATTGFAVFNDGRSMSLTDRGAVAFLGGALHSGLDPVAYAEVLTAWHSGTRGSRVAVRTDELGAPGSRLGLGPPGTVDTSTGLRLDFHSWVARPGRTESPSSVDVRAWSVDVPYEGLARWRSQLVAEGLVVPSEPAPTASR